MMHYADVLRGLPIATLGTAATVLFCTAFLMILIWVFRRPRREVEQWARQPLDDE